MGFTMIYFELIFVCAIKKRSIWILSYKDRELLWCCVGICYPSSAELSKRLCPNQWIIFVHSWTVCSVPLIWKSPFSPIPNCLDSCRCIKSLFFVLGLWHFHMNFRVSFSMSTNKKKSCWNFLSGLCWIYRSIRLPFNNMDCFNPWTWSVSPFISISSDFLQQGSVVFSREVLNSTCQPYCWVSCVGFWGVSLLL